MATNRKRHDLDTHHLIELREPPASLVALRAELSFHPDIVEYASVGQSFSECLGRIALKLDIVLDGDYDAEKLCEVLEEGMRNRRLYPGSAGLLGKGLVRAELVETEGELILRKVENNEAPIVVPEGGMVVHTNLPMPLTTARAGEDRRGLLADGQGTEGDQPSADGDDKNTDGDLHKGGRAGEEDQGSANVFEGDLDVI